MNELNDTSHSLNSSIGSAIKKARLAAGLTQVDLAQKMDIAQQMISIWESSDVIRTDSLLKLCELLAVTPDELLGFKEPKSIPHSPKLIKAMEEITKLPKRQQDKILDVVKAFTSHKAS